MTNLEKEVDNNPKNIQAFVNNTIYTSILADLDEMIEDTVKKVMTAPDEGNIEKTLKGEYNALVRVKDYFESLSGV